MKIDQESIKALCGESTEVVVFGFGKYDYKEVCHEINKNNGIQAFHSDDYLFKNEDLGKGTPHSMYGYFKLILNDLILENYKKKKEGKPTVPLIFVVGKSSESYDPHQIAKREDDPYEKWVTLTELRRVYKLATEFGPEFSQVALDTVKFVSLETLSDVTKLKPVTPFWESKDWQSDWQKRKEETKLTHNRLIKNSIWRTNLQDKIQEIDDQYSNKKNNEENKL
ncbi:Uncharacterised protein [Legionella steigerwaltii]|uniref:Uncharacterized protein n=1 Tax=Legionella steigerwaltii TaxID=460 RepID=A0A378LC06_9GAMM|nr:hypothetical protein [Legionella steigerwaltii]KTD79559.1 hypothetical protein Lstg_0775 [Legionella steigerwaltii]STY24555.1 Uncharacterised protein [Legionella steigerwaltii]